MILSSRASDSFNNVRVTFWTSCRYLMSKERTCLSLHDTETLLEKPDWVPRVTEYQSNNHSSSFCYSWNTKRAQNECEVPGVAGVWNDGSSRNFLFLEVQGEVVGHRQDRDHRARTLGSRNAASVQHHLQMEDMINNVLIFMRDSYNHLCPKIQSHQEQMWTWYTPQITPFTAV